MARRILTECPYCHRKVSYVAASVLKMRGEHCCKGCKCISNVVFSRVLYALGSLACVSGLLILVLYTAMGDHSDLHGLLYVFLPFLIFYLLTPFFVRLEPCVDNSAVTKLRRKVNPIPAADIVPPKKTETTIELEVAAGFSDIFQKAKKSTKHPDVTELTEESLQDSRIIDEEEQLRMAQADAAVDIDISASVKKDSEETLEESVSRSEEELPEEAVPESIPPLPPEVFDKSRRLSPEEDVRPKAQPEEPVPPAEAPTTEFVLPKTSRLTSEPEEALMMPTMAGYYVDEVSLKKPTLPEDAELPDDNTVSFVVGRRRSASDQDGS